MQGQFQMGQIYEQMTGMRNPVGSFLQRNSMPHFEVDVREYERKNVTEKYKRTRKRQSLDVEQTIIKQTMQKIGEEGINNQRFHRPCQSLLLQKINVQGQKRTGKKLQLQKSWMHQYDKQRASVSKLNPERINSFDQIIDTYEQSLEQAISKAKRQEMRKHSVLPQLKAKNIKEMKESINLSKANKQKKESYEQHTASNQQHKIRSSHLISKRYTEGSEVIGARSRKQRIFLQKKNNQEKKIQDELIKYHKETKMYCESIARKYSLVPALTQKKYLKKRTKKQRNTDDNIELAIEQESLRFSQLLDDVVRLNMGLQNKQEELQLLERVMDVNPFAEYMDRIQAQIQEIQQQRLQESIEDTEEQSSNTNQNGEKWQVSSHLARQNDPAFNFILRPHHPPPEYQANIKNRTEFAHNHQQNPLHINERLKSLLF